MAATAKQITANQLNAEKSTGPKSAGGKAVSSRNATRHGLLSARIFLPDEKPQEFQLLFEELSASLTPSGVMEMMLVEKIAVAIWKQRRLVAAETGAISLRRQPEQVIKQVNAALNITYSLNALTKSDFEPCDRENAAWCQSVLAEYRALAAEENVTVETLQTIAPESWQHLQAEAEDEDEESAAAYLKSRNTSLAAWLEELRQYAGMELEKALQRPRNIELYKNAFAEQGILDDKYRDSLERYQAALDNQLYKAMKELRQLQEWRLKTLETVQDADVRPVQGGE